MKFNKNAKYTLFLSCYCCFCCHFANGGCFLFFLLTKRKFYPMALEIKYYCATFVWLKRT